MRLAVLPFSVALLASAWATQVFAAARLSPDLSALDSVPLALVRAPLAKSIEAAASKSQPYQFAVRAPLSVTLADGLWDRPDTQTWRWRMRVVSPGAESLNLEFAKFQLPEGASLWIYDTDGKLVQGPYIAANRTQQGNLWTALVLGSQAVLELRVPYALRDQAELELGAVNHGFRGFAKDGLVAKSGSCNVDVICPAGDAWRDQIRSVGVYSLNGNLICTGELLNNVLQDEAPLFVTANHCQVTEDNADSIVVYWNFFNSTCRSSTGSSERQGDGLLTQNQSGATLKANDADADFALLLLDDAPNPDFGVYYSGWDARNQVPQSGVSIHHPKADEKSISTYDDATAVDDKIGFGLPPVDAWMVTWTQGTTQAGSSGGGLWNQDKRLIGWLTGGDAGCGQPTDNGSPDGEDYFGRLEVGYAGKPAASQQLKAWLDPTSTGVLFLDGLTPLRAVDDSVVAPRDSSGNLFEVLANDSGGSGGLSITSVGTPNQGGSASIAGSRISYAPAAGFTGTETFSYTISNGESSDTATVSVSVFVLPDDGGGGASPALLLIFMAAALRRRRWLRH
jgi:hypothetical protein